MESHALKYSQGYAADKRKGTNYTFWSKNFDDMAFKTMLRQLISKWGIMSIEMQAAYESDNAVINEDGTKTYVEMSGFEAVTATADEVQNATEAVQEPSGHQDDATKALFG